MPKPKLDEFTRGYLVATAHVARCGHDTLANEMMNECGVTKRSDLKGKGLEAFDRLPLEKVLRLGG